MSRSPFEIGSKIAPSEITPESVYFTRRRFLQVGLALSAGAWLGETRANQSGLLPGDVLNSWEQITRYNNFYEYSPDKQAVATLAQNLVREPWLVSIEGEVEHPRTVDVSQLIREFGNHERISRLRCVEGWSMVIPWNGFPLAQLIAKAQPTSRARFVRFAALHDPNRMYGQRRQTLPWPYTEGLTIAEAMHPLSFIATGLYGKPLPPQNGAPLRLVVPWKYGFKSIKSIVSIRLEADRPATTWNQTAPGDYGFFANVNPERALARGTQSRENRIGELMKRKTEMFNGYADQVASLYTGMNLQELY